MELALTAPGLGYYATSDRRPTREGDFLTAPELHPFFGRCLGRQLHEVWLRMDAPARFTVREWGAGRGTLEAAVVAGLRADRSELADALEWQPIDVGGRSPGDELTGAILANEFLDALPVHRVVRRGTELRERFVTWDGGLREVEGDPSTPALADHLAADGVELADGQLAEICLDAVAWVHAAGHSLSQGVLLIVDYGHPADELYGPRRMAGSLVTYRGHRAGSDPFEAVGRQDITAHVDLTAVDRAAMEVGLEPLGSTTQARFLASLGLGGLLSELGRDVSTDAETYLAARSAVARLLDPRHLGGFRVVAHSRRVPADAPLMGFADAAG
jgi:SAM-dependent MidA family methyltransferase